MDRVLNTIVSCFGSRRRRQGLPKRTFKGLVGADEREGDRRDKAAIDKDTRGPRQQGKFGCVLQLCLREKWSAPANGGRTVRGANLDFDPRIQLWDTNPVHGGIEGDACDNHVPVLVVTRNGHPSCNTECGICLPVGMARTRINHLCYTMTDLNWWRLVDWRHRHAGMFTGAGAGARPRPPTAPARVVTIPAETSVT